MQRMRRLAGGVLVMVLVAACGDDDDGDDGSASTTEPGEEVPADAVDEADDETPAPPDPCTFVDPRVVADAAGITIDVTDEDGSSDVDLGSFATRSCSYANGQMTVSTLAIGTSVEEIRADFVANAESAGGTVLGDLDLGTLPPSTLVTDVNGLLSVNVLEADQPFGLGFTTLDDPAAAIAAAEAVLNAP